MFHSVLVANRGEIACRIFSAARSMGIKTIAVYSEADGKAKHAREGDIAIAIGPAPARESYLRGDKIIAAAKATGAEAIHPGYGFLSENAEFAEAVIAAGLIWIGPTPAAIRAMGLKDEAKRLAIAAGVPVLEGYQGGDQSEKRLLKAAKDVGFPVLIKAVAGGGGRGIREVRSADAFKAQLESAQREAKAAFGNDGVLIEKLVERPRHIEVQVFGDKHGNVVHLFERDCSLQRRRQKVIEEAPAPGMSEDVRAAMTEAAVKLARAVNYENAGTVEFIVDGNGSLRADGFWFLEMNTRLQVEHPVTEMITGLNLVEWQFRVAAGEELPCNQDEITLNGHAIEARICAEDPSEEFRPSVGRITRFSMPHVTRMDGGFDEGDEVSSAYDSLLAKAIVYAHDRSEAASTLAQALASSRIEGVSTNVGFLRRCLLDPAFESGDVHVGLIAERGAELTSRAPAIERAALVAALQPLLLGAQNSDDPWRMLDGWRLNSAPRLRFMFEHRGESVSVDLAPAPASANRMLRERAGVRTAGMAFAATVNGRTQMIACVDCAAQFVTLIDVQGLFSAQITMAGDSAHIAVDGAMIELAPPGASAEHQGLEAGDEIKAPLPGKIVAINVAPGDGVTKGQGLIALEAMKMEHALKAPRDGVIASVSASVGEQVKEGAVLVRLVEA